MYNKVLNHKTEFLDLDQRLVALIEILELLFPERIRAYYLSGSALNGNMVKHSDIDVIAVFKGEFAAGEAERLWDVRGYLSALGDRRYDIVPRCEVQLQQDGATGLKLATELLYGTDIREEIPLEPLEQFQHDAVAGFVYYARELRGSIDQLIYPLSYPDPADFYFGYTNDGMGDDKGTAGTRLIINCITLGATASILLETAERCTSKVQAVQRYKEIIGGRWGDWLAELFELCKLKWQYELPSTAAEQEQLRALLSHTVAYENTVLTLCREIITAASDMPIIWKREDE